MCCWINCNHCWFYTLSMIACSLNRFLILIVVEQIVDVLFSYPFSPKIVTRLKWSPWVTPALWRHQNPWQYKEASPCIISMSVGPHKCEIFPLMVESVPKWWVYYYQLPSRLIPACKHSIRQCVGQCGTSVPRTTLIHRSYLEGMVCFWILANALWKYAYISRRGTVLLTNQWSLGFWEDGKYMECWEVATVV